MKRSPSHSRQQRQNRFQFGLGLLEVLLFIVMIGGITAVGFMQWRERETKETARQERLILSQADAAILTFVTVHHRLPCPDNNRDGIEDCAATSQKGWLPSVSLQLSGADPGVSVGQLRYLVQRGSPNIDLTVLSDTWTPLKYDSSFSDMRPTTANGGDYQANILTMSDLCHRLDLAQTSTGASVTASFAQVATTPIRAVAYALAHPGLVDADGDGNIFDGANNANDNIFEDPRRRQVLSTYDDLVLERSFSGLRSAFHCEQLAQSINTVELGLDVVAQVDDMRTGNIDAAIRAVAFAGLGAGITAIEVTASIIELASDSGNAAAEFAACVASLGIAVNFCSAAPIHVGSAITAGVAAGLNIASIAANVVAMGLAGNALALADRSSSPASIPCTVPDLTPALNTSSTDLADARSKLTALETQLTQKETALTTANAARTAAIAALYSAARNAGVSSAIDTYVNGVIAGADGWITGARDYDVAITERNRLQTTYNSLVTQVADYDNMIANRATLITQRESEISALQVLIAAETDPAIKQSLQLQLARKNGDLSLLKNLTVLLQERIDTEAKRVQAATDLAAAQTAVTNTSAAASTSLNGYRNAYFLVNSQSLGPYSIQQTIITTVFGCTPPLPPTPACPAGSVLTSANVNLTVIDLMGYNAFPFDNGANQPNENSKFRLPKKLEQELVALRSQVTAARDRATSAQASYNNLLAQSSNPPACNISGSGVSPWAPATASGLLLNTDAKGATR